MLQSAQVVTDFVEGYLEGATGLVGFAEAENAPAALPLARGERQPLRAAPRDGGAALTQNQTMLMEVIPLDASLVKGSHGCRTESRTDWPVAITPEPDWLTEEKLKSTDIHDLIMRALN